ncbi:MAG: HD domain-containing protein [Candidatus Moraniibacteriota bacterium]
MTLEDFNPEKSKPKIYLPEVRAIIEIINNEGDDESKDFLKKREKDLAGMSAKKDTLRHSQRMTNLGYLLAKERNFSEEEIKFFVEICLLHDIGKIQLPQKYLARPFGKFSAKDFEVVRKHSIQGYAHLKQEKRSPRVYNPILIHHEFQEQPYPDTKASVLKLIENIEDIDVDNARLLAMIDVFDRRVFGSSNIPPQPRDQAEEELKKQFDQPGDEEVINFLFDQYEKIKNLNI